MSVKTKIFLSFDPGSSLTKAIYQLDRGDGVEKKKHLLLMEPHVLSVPLSKVKAHQKTAVAGPLGDRLWVQSQHQSEYEVAAVGFLAQQFMLGAGGRYQELKYEVALYKLLAVIGLIVETHQLAQPVHLSVSCVLPYGEYGNREQLGALLSQNVRQFQFLETPIEAILDYWHCSPESFGFLNLAQGKKSQAQEHVVALMLGHRNTSCLVFRRGMLVPQASQSTDLGFRQLVESVAQRASIQDQSLLMQVLYKLERLGKPINAEEPLIQRLCQSRDPKNRSTEARLIANAITECIEEYWSLVSSWLSSQVPLTMDQVLIAGGVSHYLQPRLREYFWSITQYWGEDYLTKIPKRLGFKALGLDSDVVNCEAFTVRLMDIYGIHSWAMEQQSARPTTSAIR